MDRALLERNLAVAEKHVLRGEEHVRQQRELVAQLERDGHDALLSREILKTFEQSLRMHVENRDRLIAQLSHRR